MQRTTSFGAWSGSDWWTEEDRNEHSHAPQAYPRLTQSLRSNGSQWLVRRTIRIPRRLISNFFHPAKTPSYLQPTASTAQRAASSAPSKASKRSRHPTTTRHAPPQSHAPLPHSKDAPSTLGDGSSSKGELKSSVPKSRAVSRQRPSLVSISYPPAVFHSRRRHLLVNHPNPLPPRATQHNQSHIRTLFKSRHRCNRGCSCSQIYKTVCP